MRHRMTLALAGAVVAGAVLAPTASAAPDYTRPGPHAVSVTPGGLDHTVYYPADLGSGHPILLWGNGTGVTPAAYDGLLRHVASWGFVVAAATTRNAGSGAELLAGARYLIAENRRPGSRFHGALDESRIGATGHSQGGGGALVAGADPLVDTVVAIQPGPQGRVAALRGPALFLAGQFDLIVPARTVRSRYAEAEHVPAVYAALRGTGHFLIGSGVRERLAGAVTAWFRYWLADDQDARAVFFDPCGLCADRFGWSAVERNWS